MRIEFVIVAAAVAYAGFIMWAASVDIDRTQRRSVATQACEGYRAEGQPTVVADGRCFVREGDAWVDRTPQVSP